MKPGLMIGMSGVSFNQSSPFISPTDDVARKGMGCPRLIWAAGIVFALAGLFCAAGGCSVRPHLNREFFKYHDVVDRTPADVGLVYENLAIPVASRTLQGWYVPATGPSRHDAAVLIFHGVGGTIADWVPMLRYFSSHGIAAMIFDYSAYGNSTGEREYSNLPKDGAAALALFYRKTGPGVRRYVLGESMGAGVALQSVNGADSSLDGLVLIAAWRSWRGWLSDTGRVPCWLTWILPDVFNNEALLKKTSKRVLIVQGEVDELMPVAGAQRLYRAAGSRAQLRIVPGLGHEIPMSGQLDAYWQPIIQFMTRNQ